MPEVSVNKKPKVQEGYFELQAFVFISVFKRAKSKLAQCRAMSSAEENPRKWRFTWEAQSQIPILRLFLFDSHTKPSIQCQNLKVDLNLSQSLLQLSWFDDRHVSLRVPIPRVLLDPESPLSFTAFDDHIQVKLVLLLPVDHPIVSSFDSVLNFSQGLENASFDASKPLEMDSGELSFNALVKDINKIRMRLVAEKVRETEIRKLESNFFYKKKKRIIMLLWCNCNQLLCREWSSYECFSLLCYNLLFSILRKCWFFWCYGCVVQIWRCYLLVKEFIFTVEVAHLSWPKLLSGN